MPHTRKPGSQRSIFRLKKKYLIVILAFIIAGGYIAYAKASSSSASATYVTAQVQKGMIASDVSGSGNMSVGDSANVIPAVSGTVSNLAVNVGDKVTRGEVLFTIVNDQLDINTSKSYASLLQAEQSLDSANASEAQAQADLDNANGQAGSPAEANIAALQAKLSSAQTSESVAQQNLSIAQTNYQNSATVQNLNALNQAETQYVAAQANVAQSQSDLVKAQQQNQASGESIDSLSMKLQAAQASISAAQQSVAAAQADYQNQQNIAGERTVTAPIDGTITALNVQNGGSSSSSGGSSGGSSSSGSGGSSGGSSSSGSGGSSGGSSSSGSGGSSGGSSSAGGSSGGSGGASSSGGGASSSGGGASSSGASSSSGGASSSSATSSASSSQAAMVIQNLDTVKATVQASEVDVPKLAVGQKATLTFDAIDNLTLTGKVEKIDSAGTVSSGVVTYNVTVGLDTSDPRVKPGMSVTAAITTAVKQDVLTVPNSALKTQGNGSYVEVMVNGTPHQQNVVTGLANDTDTEIASGLNEGDTVVTQTINPGATPSQTPSPSSGLGGLGGGTGSGRPSGGFGGGTGGAARSGGG